jgi:membrane-associated phospholipid phosphatase
LHHNWRNIHTIVLHILFAAFLTVAAQAQNYFSTNTLLESSTSGADLEDGLSWPIAADNDSGTNEGPDSIQSEPQGGVVSRSVKRVLEDQKQMYLAPFRPSNLKWTALVLGGTALFLATDRHIENNLPGGHYQLYQNSSNIAIGGLAAALGGVWLYGIKTEHHHARETGALELEALVNTFLIYTPMQFIAGRQRPGEGNGHGDFFKHHNINTSFPGGHAMFMWTMATVLSHEYSQPWVQVAAYGSAFTVTLTRFLARDHWASDMWVGTALGIGIGAHVFHAHCDPELSPKCRHHYEKIGQALHLTRESLYRPQEYYSEVPFSQ